jgi:hypothetical protein
LSQKRQFFGENIFKIISSVLVHNEQLFENGFATNASRESRHLESPTVENDFFHSENLHLDIVVIYAVKTFQQLSEQEMEKATPRPTRQQRGMMVPTYILVRFRGIQMSDEN